MEDKILVDDEAYLILRRDSREALGRLGIDSNPAFTDNDILSRLSGILGREELPEQYDEWSEYSAEMFRDNLASILGIELPASIVEIRSNLAFTKNENINNISQAWTPYN